MYKMPKKAGFILIELVTVLILVGIIGVFSGFFLFTGMQGYLTSKQTSEGALQAQTALERISKELIDIKSLPVAPVANSSVTYTSSASSELPGQRSISYSNNVISITVDGTPYPLLTDVRSFSLAWEKADLNDDGTDEISGFTISFTAGEIGQPFSARIYPRRFFTAPPPPP